MSKKMKILIPLAGAGSRFFKAGYKDPKPLIDVSGKPMIQRVIENIGLEENEHIFIVQEQHMQKYPHMKKYLKECVKNSTLVEINGLTEGAACTTLLAKEHINNDEPLFIANGLIGTQSTFNLIAKDLMGVYHIFCPIVPSTHIQEWIIIQEILHRLQRNK